MEPPKGVLAGIWNFLYFLPFFTGLLLLGIIKGIVFCPLICLIMTTGNSAIILGLWPAHAFWTYFCIVRAEKLGSVLKLVLCPCITVVLILWPLIGISSSILGGAAYGLLAPIFATLEAVGEGKTDVFFHCICDGTWSTVLDSFTVIRDFADVCFHSYFSVMDELRTQRLPEGDVYEIRLLRLPGTLSVGVLGIMFNVPAISLIALCKSPYMLFKGWHRLIHDLIGREGPFLETICVPIAGLIILLWPLAVAGAVIGSMVSSIFMGAYAGVVVYQEDSPWLGLCFMVASVSLFDEYSNDVLDMPEGSCLPRPQFRREAKLSRATTRESSISGSSSSQNPPSRSISFKNEMMDLKLLEVFDSIFKDCHRFGETMVSEGLISVVDIEEAVSRKGGDRFMSIGLPAYCLLQTLLRSAKANADGLLLGDNVTEISRLVRPRDTFSGWFLDPLLIIKDQIIASGLSEAEEDYLCRSVLFGSNTSRSGGSDRRLPPQWSERRRAELDAFARRLRGITVSISRYPTFRRRFEGLLKALCDDIAGKNGGSGGGGDGNKLTIVRAKKIYNRGKSSSSGSNRGESRLVEIG